MTEPLRVLSLGTLYPPYAIGGYEVVWRDTVGRLRRDGHQVKVLASTWTVNNNGEDEDPEIRRELALYIDDLLDVVTESRDETVNRERRNRKLIDEVIDEFQPDVAFLGPVGGLPLSLVTRIRDRGIPQAAFVGDEWPKYAPKADPGQRLLGLSGRLRGRGSRERVEGRRFRYSDIALWVCGSDQSADVVRRAGADPATMTVLKPGPDTRRFTRQDPRPWRGRLLYAGRLHRDKGVEHAITALAEAPGCLLLIAGAGDPRYAEKLKRVAAESEVLDRIKLLGEQRERLPELYAAVDAVIFPSVWKEPWGLVPLEAMAVGRPVIATAVGGSAEYLRDGENALVVPPADPVAIAMAVERLARDEELRKRLVERGWATADEYRYDRFLDRLAGAVVALGEESGMKEQDTSVSESHEHEPTSHPAGEEASAPAAEAASAPAAEDRATAPQPAQPVTSRRFAPPVPQPVTAGKPKAEASAPAEEPSRAAQPQSPGQPPSPPEAPAPAAREPTPRTDAPEAPKPAPQADAPEPPKPAPEADESEPEEATGGEAEAEDEATPDEAWLPEGYELVEKEPATTRAETTEWAAVREPEPAEDEGADTTAEAQTGQPAPAPATGAAQQPVGGEAIASLVARLGALEGRVEDLSSAPELAALEARLAELAGSTVAGIERNASELATLEGRVSELATSAVAGVERNAGELTAIEKRVSELAKSAVERADRSASELAAFEARMTEMAQSAGAGVQRNAAQLATIETRLGELAATAATAREHQGSELGSLQTRVGELAAFAELRSEALGQRLDELEQTVKDAESSRGRSVDELVTRLGAIEQRLATLDSRLEGVESATEPLAELASRVDRIEALATQVWQREEAAIEQHRASSEELEQLSGMAKLNDASFEQLRALGLSGTQAARVLAAREARSGFDSVDELATIPGFPPAVITELKQLVES